MPPRPHTRLRGRGGCRCIQPAHTRTPAPAQCTDRVSGRHGSCTEAAPTHDNNGHRQSPRALISKRLMRHPGTEGPGLHATFHGHGAGFSFIAELFPPAIRYTASNFGQNIGTVLSGGSAPLVCGTLLLATGPISVSPCGSPVWASPGWARSRRAQSRERPACRVSRSPAEHRTDPLPHRQVAYAGRLTERLPSASPAPAPPGGRRFRGAGLSATLRGSLPGG